MWATPQKNTTYAIKFILVSTFHKSLSALDDPGMQMKDSFYEMV